MVDQFVSILDRLEQIEADEQREERCVGRSSAAPRTRATQRDYVRPLPRGTPSSMSCVEIFRGLGVADAIDALFRHLRRVVPAASVVIYAPAGATTRLRSRARQSALARWKAFECPLAERISGWVYARRPAVMNSDAALELGPWLGHFRCRCGTRRPYRSSTAA